MADSYSYIVSIIIIAVINYFLRYNNYSTTKRKGIIMGKIKLICDIATTKLEAGAYADFSKGTIATCVTMPILIDLYMY